ncbi:hypothetical protein FRB94_012613 [Tulasnella sp. JGI-2019a]|nr:hypothetical protein FRB93_010500 [Tulasnella sp. JGI-2019a]KAG8991291.1 hypothetical protein FRB94_012613 [Tulasnella sp. JGI-2019a]KAG9025980.1 hypothetical protein FRB95_009525 [Tulasnella sp. JGI-2019a]
MSLKLKIRIPPAFKRSAPEPEPIAEPQDDDKAQDDGEDSPMEEENAENQQSSNESNPNNDGDDDGEDRHSFDYESNDNSRSASVNPFSQLQASAFQLQQPLATSSKLSTAGGTKQSGKARKSRSKLFGRVTPKVPKPIQYDVYGFPIFPAPKGPPKPKPLVEVIQRLLARIKKKDDYGIFHEPVDTTAVPTYTDIIKNPMDLSTMKKKLDTGLYRTFQQFSDDFNLMISNCKTFNPAPSLYHSEATKLETFGKDLISQSTGLVIEPGPNDPIYVAPTVQETAMASKPIAPASPSTSTIGNRRGRPPVIQTHARQHSTTVDDTNTALFSAVGVASGSNTATSTVYHPSHPSSLPDQKVWVRGPYKKTIQRDPVVVGPGGELPGTTNGVGAFPTDSPFGKLALALEIRGPRWRTKKERIEMEKRGRPVLWDGSVDWAAMDDVHQVFSHFLPEPFDIPPLQSLTQPPPQDTKFLSLHFPVATTASHVASRTSSIVAQQEKSHLSPFFTWNPALSTSRRSIAYEPNPDQIQTQDEVRYAYPERWVRPTDFGVFNNLAGTAEQARRTVDKEETARYSGKADVEGVMDSVEYVRDVGYGGTDGLAWTRSVMDFVGGAKRSEEAQDDGDEWVWEDAPGGMGLGMSLEDWVTQNVLSPATGDVHDALGSAAKHLVHRGGNSDLDHKHKREDMEMKTESEGEPDPVQAQLNKSLNVNPVLRQHISTIVAARKEPIALSALVKSPEDFQKGDEEWDPEYEPSSAQSSFPPVFKQEWAERALEMAAKTIERLADGDGSDNVKMEVDGVGKAGTGAESEEQKRLRFNLLALAKFVPIHEGVRL